MNGVDRLRETNLGSGGLVLANAASSADTDALAKWAKFQQQLRQLDDQLLTTIFAQVRVASFQPDLQRVTAHLPEAQSFFKDLLMAREAIWISTLQSVFGLHVRLELQVVSEPIQLVVDTESQTVDLATVSAVTLASAITGIGTPKAVVEPGSRVVSNGARSRHTSSKLDLSNPEQWPKTALLLEFFPGSVTEIDPWVNVDYLK